jgi:TonB family protein
MIRPLLLIVVAAATAAGASAQPRVAPLPVPPPLFAPANTVPTLVAYRSGSATCGGAAQRVVRAEEPFPSAWWPSQEEAVAASGGWDASLRFRIDRAGRPLSIAGSSQAPQGPNEGDLFSAFAAWRFAPGPARASCEIRFQAEPVPVATAAEQILYRYLVSRHLRRSPFGDPVVRAVYRRVRPSGTVCADGSLGNWQVAYPDWGRIVQPPGTFSWTYLRADVGSEGVPHDAAIIGSSGNAELDRESIAAVERSRYASVERHGCLFYYVRFPSGPLQAPPVAAMRDFRPRGARCPDPGLLWVEPPDPDYPPSMRLRRIEGWAIVRFDLTPEGNVRNPALVASEPAAAFGEAALAAVSLSRTKPSSQGLRGCVVPIVFRRPPAIESAP